MGPEELAVLKSRELNASRDIDRAMWANEFQIKAAANERISRRVRLAMRVASVHDAVTPAAGVLLLRRVGIEVSQELLDAVAERALSANTEEAELTYRELMRLNQVEDLAAAASEELTNVEAVGHLPLSPNIARLKKAALVKKFKYEWPSADADIGNGVRNGLTVAKLGGGFYDVEKSLKWARENGKFKDLSASGSSLNSILNSPMSVKKTLS